ncbi:hypothetical protein D3C83_91530 [compost metagenome]
MAARHQQGEEGKLGTARGEQGGEQVAFQMMDPEHRHPQRKGEPMRERSAH